MKQKKASHLREIPSTTRSRSRPKVTIRTKGPIRPKVSLSPEARARLGRAPHEHEFNPMTTSKERNGFVRARERVNATCAPNQDSLPRARRVPAKEREQCAAEGEDVGYPKRNAFPGLFPRWRPIAVADLTVLLLGGGSVSSPAPSTAVPRTQCRRDTRGGRIPPTLL